MAVVSAGLLLWRQLAPTRRGGRSASPAAAAEPQRTTGVFNADRPSRWRQADGIELLLVHLGGPFWRNKDQGAWFIPKGEALPGESLLQTARREFGEETGFPSPEEPVDENAPNSYLALGSARRASGKQVAVFAFEGNCDPARLRSNTFEMEWPPRSGRTGTFPEVDRAAFFPLAAASAMIHPSERVFLERFARQLQRK